MKRTRKAVLALSTAGVIAVGGFAALPALAGGETAPATTVSDDDGATSPATADRDRPGQHGTMRHHGGEGRGMGEHMGDRDDHGMGIHMRDHHRDGSGDGSGHGPGAAECPFVTEE
ncbi:hypothetical protein [Phytoactinopolyspora halotolerans]|uniref:Uncharacterized protein n=1 Tax=Phytoactinopolyspora halotolerans TaxID=1981512 RepID=A0A6L9S6C6_9ACTN|nr:hypothetical protein [Phytoactinopolyspora halotolerans]NEE00619.1 hypothetical protein [Phytoactinopolyspora halotolerans]